MTDISKIRVTDDVRRAVAAYLVARAKAEVLREAVDAVFAEILAEREIYPAEEWRKCGDVGRILDHDRLSWSELHDFNAVIAEASCIERERGIKPADMEEQYCPALVAEHAQLEAEWAILKAGFAMIGSPADDWKRLYGDKRAQFLDLVVRLVVNEPGRGIRVSV